MGTKRVAPYEDWINVNTGKSYLRWVEPDLKRMSGPWRVWEVCLGRMNNWGHAAFDPGELAELATGENTRTSRYRVAKWIETLADMRRIKPPDEQGGSTQLCVIVNCELAWRGAGRASDYFCSEPSHRKTRRQTWPETGTEATVTDPAPAPVGTEATVTDPKSAPVDNPWRDESPTASDTSQARAQQLLSM